MRYLSGIKADMFIECEDRLFEIQSVIDVDFEHKMLEIDAVEKVKKAG
jgi:SPP1 family predicted phage head-tail adaptor